MKFEQIPSTKIEEAGFGRYESLGGILTEAEYTEVMEELSKLVKIDSHSLSQAKDYARLAGIEIKQENDIRAALFDVLRLHLKPGLIHPTLISDQPIFAEVLRMLGDIPSLDIFLQAHPGIFKAENK